jgi:hypothetical protein
MGSKYLIRLVIWVGLFIDLLLTQNAVSGLAFTKTVINDLVP